MLAIVIPFYKISFFRETLDSLARQTNKNFNVYIGNDASPDDPEPLIEIYGDSINIVYRRFHQNLGSHSLTKQWERCIALSKEERWIMILGDDDFLSENYVEEFYRHLNEIEARNLKVVRFASREINEVNGKMTRLFTHPTMEKSTDFFYRKFIEKSTRGSLTEQIFQREAYLKSGFRNFSLGWGSDNFAWLEFSEFGSVYSINDATAFFRISDENISRWGYKTDIKQRARLKYFTILIKQYLKRFEKRQQISLLKYYEQLMYRTKVLSVQGWWLISSSLLRRMEAIEFGRFHKRLLLFLIKR